MGYWECVGAWRSLVARTVRVGEVPSSNLGAPIAPPFPTAYGTGELRFAITLAKALQWLTGWIQESEDPTAELAAALAADLADLRTCPSPIQVLRARNR